MLAAGVDQDKIDCQPNTLLLELWRELKPEQFRLRQKLPTEKARLVVLKGFLKS